MRARDFRRAGIRAIAHRELAVSSVGAQPRPDGQTRVESLSHLSVFGVSTGRQIRQGETSTAVRHDHIKRGWEKGAGRGHELRRRNRA